MNNQKNHLYLAELLMDILPKAMQSMREDMRKGRGERLTIPQFRVLSAVYRGIIYNKEIGDLLGVSEAATSRMIDFLVKEGLLKKGINTKDRRQKSLELTLEGEKLYMKNRIAARESIKNKVELLNSDNLDNMIKSLEILRDDLDYLRDK